MPNDITSNPMFFDSVTSADEIETLKGMHYIEKVEWVADDEDATNNIAADDVFKVTDTKGTIWYSKLATYDGDDYGSGKLSPPDGVVGIKITRLDGGVVRIQKSPVQR